ncbi:hypothetical protein IV38_GL000568 [Lactobacillus selangorensis]|uniref:N-acetylmuramoyl-L-alanine amidase domain-containing protein n=1 Tax=Lactobacillus selangorensis TaxID=81857 RepID=A0A0R2FM57_9LACO|nr:N-acetylmuramoyl-L-alanine amidase [Lactobacillus selangorensis]KRN29681.1 hypothetical protein IV38_GL000568 [Lactobacillus selangorensis]KRN33790.1 hypothetical protein IV40_GL000100 [Lactobacillus selangorensis]
MLTRFVKQRFIPNLPETGPTENRIIVLHEAGDYRHDSRQSLKKAVERMRQTPTERFVHYLIGGGHVTQLAPVGRIAWSAGPEADQAAYAQVELTNTNNPLLFMHDYEAYIHLIRRLAFAAEIPLTLDDDSENGIKSHAWVSAHYQGRHQDPWAYFDRFGVNQQLFAQDLLSGHIHRRMPVAPRDFSRVKEYYRVPDGQVLAVRAIPDRFAPVIAEYVGGQEIPYTFQLQLENHQWLGYATLLGQPRYLEIG